MKSMRNRLRLLLNIHTPETLTSTKKMCLYYSKLPIFSNSTQLDIFAQNFLWQSYR